MAAATPVPPSGHRNKGGRKQDLCHTHQRVISIAHLPFNIQHILQLRIQFVTPHVKLVLLLESHELPSEGKLYLSRGSRNNVQGGVMVTARNFDI